ncbi:MAG TPA: MFS transporter, partial [Candidatus Tectomicrobia bacterium]|nr:MFS transporter [Candidatus Tectomicrobia bacterium]
VLAAMIPCVWRVYPATARRGAEATRDLPRAAADVGPLVRTPAFWALAFVFTVAPLVGYLATLQHAVYFAGLGFGAREAAAMLMAGGVLATAGRALAGLAADRFGGAVAGAVSYSLTLLGLLCLVGLELAPSRALAWAYVLLLFLPLGSRAAIVAVLVARIAPAGRYGTVFGLLSVGNNLGAALGPWLSGALYDWTGSYLAIWLVAAALVAAALVALAVFGRVTPRPRPG